MNEGVDVHKTHLEDVLTHRTSRVILGLFGPSTTLEDLSRLSERDLLRMDGIGRKSVCEIRYVLDEVLGVTLSSEGDASYADGMVARRKSEDRARLVMNRSAMSVEDRIRKIIGVVRRGVIRAENDVTDYGLSGLSISVSIQCNDNGVAHRQDVVLYGDGAVLMEDVAP